MPPAREASLPSPPPRPKRLLGRVEGWALSHDGKRIRREWTVKNFMAAIDFFNKVAALAEQEGHHPDLHLEGYRNVAVELWTHAIGGLSENDFILAAKINQLPIALKRLTAIRARTGRGTGRRSRGRRPGARVGFSGWSLEPDESARPRRTSPPRAGLAT